MPFITEVVSGQDIEKYSLRTIENNIEATRFSWTIDRERDIYLRFVTYDWQRPDCQKFRFYWKGTVIHVELRSLDFEGQHGGPLRETWQVISPDGTGRFWLPAQLETEREQITDDLKEALVAFRRSDVILSYADYTASFKF